MRGAAGSGARGGGGARAGRLPVWARLVVGAAALLFAPDCTRGLGDAGSGGETAEESGGGDGAGGEGGGGETEGAVLTAAVWTLAWDTEGASFPEEGGVEIETDLGYRVRVSTGRILSHSLSFGLCDPGAAASPEQATFSFGLPVRAARAHAEDADPSMIEASLVEDLTAPRDAELDSSFAAARYCRAHWLVARPLAATKGPADVPMEGRSLLVTGAAERDGRLHEIAIDTWWPDGLLVELTEAAAADALRAAGSDGEPRHAFVTVTRHLGRLFDGIDFETASGDEVTGLVLENLVGGADVEVALWAPGGAD